MAALVLPACAGVAWLIWAHHQYRGLDACPTGTQLGHPYLMGLGLALLSAGIMSTAPKWAQTSQRATIMLTILTAILAAAIILFFSLGVAGGLRCFD